MNKDDLVIKYKTRVCSYEKTIEQLKVLKEQLLTREGKVLNASINKLIEIHYDRIKKTQVYYSASSYAIILCVGEWDNNLVIMNSTITTDGRLDKDKINKFFEGQINRHSKLIDYINYTLDNYDTMKKEYDNISKIWREFNNKYYRDILDELYLTSRYL